jgi:NAD(P)-dependent dehydrogenase (short-subunit alcohol dehydrogenase family)
MTEAQKTIVITGASRGFGAMTARTLADAGHVVYAGIRDADGHNPSAVAEARNYSAANAVTNTWAGSARTEVRATSP